MTPISRFILLSSTTFLGLLVACDRPASPSLRQSLAAGSERIERTGMVAQTTPAFVADNQRGWAWTGPGAQSFAWHLPSAGGSIEALVVGPAGMRVRMTSKDGTAATDALPAGWNHVSFPLQRSLFARSVEMSLESCSDSGSCGWEEARFRGQKEDGRSRPLNLIFILVDTLRWDAVGAYGSSTKTPAIDRLAREGVLFERAFAQSSWTLPSTASMLTGQLPGDSPGWSTLGQGIPDSSSTLAEIFREAGWNTAAFVANPIVKDATGFGQGFDTYWQAPPGFAGTPAEEVARRAKSWLGVHAEDPFFLYLHLMDPHDPYAPPGRPAQAPVGNPNPSFVGDAPLPDPGTLELWKSLYAQEVEYADRQIGELLDSLTPTQRDRSIVVLTSDHGEEFMEHGYLTHGVTLFDEVIHVPLVIRHPHARKGKRVPELVRLIDLVPTLVELAEVRIPPPAAQRWAGVSLAAAVLSAERPPPLVATGETFGFGPLRWYTYDGTRKVVLFNKGYSLPAQFPALPFAHRWIEEHVPAEAAYLSTAGEPFDEPLNEGATDAIASAHGQASAYVRGKVGGVWIALVGSGTGRVQEVELTLPPSERPRVIPFFWRAADSIRIGQRHLALRVRDDGIMRLAVLPGLTSSDLASITLSGSGRGQRLQKREPPAGASGLFAWYQPEPAPVIIQERTVSDLVFRLRSLGYIR